MPVNAAEPRSARLVVNEHMLAMRAIDAVSDKGKYVAAQQRMTLSRISWLEPRLGSKAMHQFMSNEAWFEQRATFESLVRDTAPHLLSVLELSNRGEGEVCETLLNVWIKHMMQAEEGGDQSVLLTKESNEEVALPMVPQGTNWLDMFVAATAEIPHALCVVDMRVGGLPLVHINRAWELLTEYPRAEALGRNARLLQGADTEEAVVAEAAEVAESDGQ